MDKHWDGWGQPSFKLCKYCPLWARDYDKPKAWCSISNEPTHSNTVCRQLTDEEFDCITLEGLSVSV